MFHLDAQDIDGDNNSSNNPADNSPVTAIIDNFNSHTGSQIISSKQARFNINGINSLPAIKFDGVDDIIEIQDSLDI